MSQPEIKVISATQVRRSLTQPGDIRGEVAFQNDINALLARFDEVKVPWRALAGPAQTIPPSIVADDTPVPSPLPAAAPRPRIKRIDVTFPRLRVVDGGAPMVGPSMELVPVAAPPAPRIALQTTPPPRVIAVPGRTTAARTPRRRG